MGNEWWRGWCVYWFVWHAGGSETVFIVIFRLQRRNSNGVLHHEPINAVYAYSRGPA